MQQVSRIRVTPINMARHRLRVTLSAFGGARASSYCTYSFLKVARYAIPVAHDAIPVARDTIRVVRDAISVSLEGGNLHWAVL